MTVPSEGRSDGLEQLLLAGGIVAALVYISTDIIGATAYPGYSYADDAVSELFAVGAPTSRLVVPLFSLSSVLLLGFALGISWSEPSRTRRLMAVMFAGSALVGLVLWNVFPMHMRGDERSFTDTMHLVLASNPFVWITLVIGVASFRNWFRWAPVAAALFVVAPALFAFHYAPALAANLPTPGLGLTERGAQYAYQAWQITFALLLLAQAKHRAIASART